MKNTLLKRTLLFIPFIFLYLVCIDKGMITIDPCSATPGRDYTIGLILLASFPFVAGILLHWCLRDFDIPKRKRYWIAGLLPSILLAISSFLLHIYYTLWRKVLEIQNYGLSFTIEIVTMTPSLNHLSYFLRLPQCFIYSC